MQNYYEILEVNETASLDEIKKSFKRLAFKYHPDINPGDELAKEKMVELIEAYDVLSDPISRNWYNLRSDKNAIDLQFEEAYQSYVKNSTERQEAIKRKLQEEREELKTRYQKINGYVSIPILLIIVPVIFFLGLEILIYLMMNEELINNASTIKLLTFGSMIASFSLFINLLHLQSLYNKYFKPNGNITEDNVPIILALSLVLAVIVFIGQPSLVRSFEEPQILEEVYVPYEYSDDFIYYKFTYKGVEYSKVKEFSGFRYYRQVDSLHIRFYPSNPNKSDIYGLWSNGMEIFYSHKFFKD